MTWLSWIFLASGTYLSAINWCFLYWSSRYKKHYSPIPLIGAVLLGNGLAGFSITRPFAWLCIVLDYGTLALVLAFPSVLNEAWCLCRINRLHQFYTLENGRETRISLFRRGHALVQMKFDATYRDKTHGGPVALSRPCRWHLTDSIYELDVIYEKRVLRIRPVGQEFVCEDAPGAATAHDYDNLNGVRMVRR